MVENEVTMSSGSDSDSSDSDIEEEVALEEVNEDEISKIELKINADPYGYQAHVDLIIMFRKCGELERLRAARERMNKYFPLAPNLWLDWIKDESGDDKLKKKLLESAVSEYRSFDVWLEYCQFVIGCASFDVEQKRAVFERAVSAVGLQADCGCLIWDVFREFEIFLLELLKPAPGQIVIENKDDEIKTQSGRIVKLFERQCVLPLMGVETALDEFKQFITESGLDDVTKQIVESSEKATKKVGQYLQPLEQKLTAAKTDAEKKLAYRAYIDLERKWGEPARIQLIFERALIHLIDPSLWLEYCQYLQDRLKISDIYLPVCERSVRNCPWSFKLWENYLLNVERAKPSDMAERLTTVFERAIEGGYQNVDEGIELWLCRSYQLRRLADFEGTTKNYDAVLGCLERGITQLNDQFGHVNEWDVALRYRKCYAFAAVRYKNDVELCRRLWKEMMSHGNGRFASLWLEDINIERQYGTVDLARKLFYQAVNSVADYPENICYAFVQFEAEEGDCEQNVAAKLRVNSHLAEVSKRQAASFSTAASYQKGGERKRPSSYQDSASFGNSKRTRQDSANSKRVPTTARPTRPTGSNSVLLGRPREPAIPTSPKDKDGFTVPATMPESVSTSDSNPKTATAAVPAGRHHVSEADASSSSRQPISATHATPMTPTEEKRFVFVSNLPYKANENELRKVFEEHKFVVKSIRFGGRTPGIAEKGFAFVEMSGADDANKAIQTMDRTPFAGNRPMYVSICSENRDKRRAALPFGTNMERSKLFVRNLAPDVTEAKVKSIFEEFGNVKAVRLVTYRSGTSKGIAYVEFEDEKSAQKALQKADNTVVSGQNISVEISNPPSRNARAEGVGAIAGQQKPPFNKFEPPKRENALEGALGAPPYESNTVAPAGTDGERRSHSKVSLVPRTLKSGPSLAPSYNREIGSLRTDVPTSADGKTIELELPSISVAKKNNDEFRKMFLK